MAETPSRPLGQLFTDVYRAKGEPVEDDSRFRVQALALFYTIFNYREHGDIASFLMRRLGIEVPSSENYGGISYDFDAWFKKCRADDFLNFITMIARVLDGRPEQERWISGISLALDQRNMKYELDDAGGVHFRIDAAFQHSKRLTLACLAGADFTAAHEELEKAFGYLTQIKPDTKMAAVNVFLAAENVFKLVAGTKSGLDEGEVGKTLTQLVQRVYAASDDATKQASSRLVQSFAKWASACHPYRHGQNEIELVAPPAEIAITLVTAGADFIRWLAELQRLKQPK